MSSTVASHSRRENRKLNWTVFLQRWINPPSTASTRGSSAKQRCRPASRLPLQVWVATNCLADIVPSQQCRGSCRARDTAHGLGHLRPSISQCTACSEDASTGHPTQPASYGTERRREARTT